MSNRSEWIVISWIPHFTSSLSCIGSSSVIYMILSNWKTKLAKPNHRLVLLLSTFDVLQSVAYGASTLAHPRDPDVYGSMGNDSTCKAQFFFVSLGLAVPMYNASLSLFFLLTIRYRLHPAYFSTKIEPVLHSLSVLVPLTVAVVPTVMNEVRGGQNAVCAIKSSSPLTWVYVIAVLTSCCVCSFSMISICCHVRRQSNKIRKYSYGTAQIQRRTSEVLETNQQAILYISALFLTFIFPAIIMATQNSYSYSLKVLREIFFPLQGFWNFVLYIRPSVTKIKRTKPDKYLCGVIWEVIFHANERNAKVRQKRHNNGDEVLRRENTIKSHGYEKSEIIEEEKEEIKNNAVIEPAKKERDYSNQQFRCPGSQVSNLIVSACLSELIYLYHGRD